jgi:hypothetical protein
MGKMVIVKLNSRKFSSNDYEDSIIQALTAIGLTYDGSDFGLEGEFNRGLYFFCNEKIEIEVVDDDGESEMNSSDEE